ncbi:unnamed protein product [Vitrella brassicaformis CCMP3155]|uniref:Uncharacterized protein n=1 Tax=Vitrella brassicaformis (strain CCMP3155) TaxID=1169540 RepID=A0A0G4ES50_VITBC|nr:unnamed protein product [Vitrella brassicaformis CCMP3155]|eukprot:CEM01275.1 unnamed protein product [Vitrella brassicaformis CCMP3155]
MAGLSIQDLSRPLPAHPSSPFECLFEYRVAATALYSGRHAPRPPDLVVVACAATGEAVTFVSADNPVSLVEGFGYEEKEADDVTGRGSFRATLDFAAIGDTCHFVVVGLCSQEDTLMTTLGVDEMTVRAHTQDRQQRAAVHYEIKDVSADELAAASVAVLFICYQVHGRWSLLPVSKFDKPDHAPCSYDQLCALIMEEVSAVIGRLQGEAPQPQVSPVSVPVFSETRRRSSSVASGPSPRRSSEMKQQEPRFDTHSTRLVSERAAVHRLMQEKEALKEQLETAVLEKSRLKASHDQAILERSSPTHADRAAVARLVREKNALSVKLEAALQDNARLVQERRELTTAAAQHQAQHAALTQLSEENVGLRKELEDALQRRARLSFEGKQQERADRATFAKLQREKETVQTELNDALAQNAQLEREKEEAIAENATARQAVKEKQKQNEELTRENERLKEAQRHYLGKVGYFETTLEHLRTENRDLTKGLKGANFKHQSSLEDIRRLDDEKMTLEDRHRSAEQRLALADGRMKQLHREKEDLRKDLEEHKRRTQSLEQELTAERKKARTATFPGAQRDGGTMELKGQGRMLQLAPEGYKGTPCPEGTSYLSKADVMRHLENLLQHELGPSPPPVIGIADQPSSASDKPLASLHSSLQTAHTALNRSITLLQHIEEGHEGRIAHFISKAMTEAPEVHRWVRGEELAWLVRMLVNAWLPKGSSMRGRRGGEGGTVIRPAMCLPPTRDTSPGKIRRPRASASPSSRSQPPPSLSLPTAIPRPPTFTDACFTEYDLQRFDGLMRDRLTPREQKWMQTLVADLRSPDGSRDDDTAPLYPRKPPHRAASPSRLSSPLPPQPTDYDFTPPQTTPDIDIDIDEDTLSVAGWAMDQETSGDRATSGYERDIGEGGERERELMLPKSRMGRGRREVRCGVPREIVESTREMRVYLDGLTKATSECMTTCEDLLRRAAGMDNEWS